MKSMQLVLLFTMFSTAAIAQDRPSTHGMLIFGKERVYLSHLPMFHNPHNYQVIAEAALPASAQTTYTRDMTTHPDQRVYTLVPETFVLPEMVQKPRPFKADLYRGHFERGGTMIAQQILVNFVNILFFKKFDPSAPHPTMSQYFAFGDPDGERFLAHLITAAPDFDQIIETKELAGTLPRVIEFKSNGADSPLGETQDRKELYLETGDLE